jgi:hypothetical protein
VQLDSIAFGLTRGGGERRRKGKKGERETKRRLLSVDPAFKMTIMSH